MLKILKMMDKNLRLRGLMAALARLARLLLFHFRHIVLGSEN